MQAIFSNETHLQEFINKTELMTPTFNIQTSTNKENKKYILIPEENIFSKKALKTAHDKTELFNSLIIKKFNNHIWQEKYRNLLL